MSLLAFYNPLISSHTLTNFLFKILMVDFMFCVLEMFIESLADFSALSGSFD